MRDRFALAYALLVDNCSALDLGLPENDALARIATLSPAVGELHELRDVPRIAGRSGDWLLVHDVSSRRPTAAGQHHRNTTPLESFTL
jgi:hypothetical protein